eukprot:CAMPEP_0181339840 /NCGR_PEP_ID=MMETSP1101-20121128/29502_1 /TAXON_ID=46948 /ORGANISM="Rhodomonas abbreviata, Strain Caron Lab Isolate" /LENGTH=552 /DNA_ID=CAMNT_0023450899 /DNA_START=208 /DNA_END=1865 /DNA_ORIENTATION=+
MLDLDSCIERCCKCEILTEQEVSAICLRLKEILMDTPNVPAVQSPVSVVGDIHGQFQDLVELFRVGGPCPSTNYLFLGDYVDRGSHSLETISLLICLSVRFPERITLLRGNHETRQITQVYGFYSECMKRYGDAAVWREFTDLFDFLPVAALIDDSLFCVHGGLSPSLLTLDQLALLDRFHEVPGEGGLADLVWSDPDQLRSGFNPSSRGAGYTFGHDVVARFLRVNSLLHVLRAHQLCMEGYQVMFDNTLSTPNYCYRCGNLACVLEVDSNLDFYFNVFGPAPPPNDAATIKLQEPQYFLYCWRELEAAVKPAVARLLCPLSYLAARRQQTSVYSRPCSGERRWVARRSQSNVDDTSFSNALMRPLQCWNRKRSKKSELDSDLRALECWKSFSPSGAEPDRGPAGLVAKHRPYIQSVLSLPRSFFFHEACSESNEIPRRGMAVVLGQATPPPIAPPQPLRGSFSLQTQNKTTLQPAISLQTHNKTALLQTQNKPAAHHPVLHTRASTALPRIDRPGQLHVPHNTTCHPSGLLSEQLRIDHHPGGHAPSPCA